MAYDGTPAAWIASWSEDGTNITVPIASLTGLTAAEADGATGDIREVLLALLETVVTEYDSLASADQPTKMSITRTTNASGSSIVRRYTISFTADPDQFQIDAE